MAWVRGHEHLVECRGYCLSVFKVDRNRPGELGKYVNYGEQVPHSAVLPGDALHISKVGLPLGIDPRHIRMVPGEPTARGPV